MNDDHLPELDNDQDFSLPVELEEKEPDTNVPPDQVDHGDKPEGS